MSLFGFIGKVATAGLNVATGGLSGTILNAAGSIIHPQSPAQSPNILPTAMPGSGAVAPTLQTSVLKGLQPTKPSIFPTSLPTPDSVKVSATNIGGLYQSGSATAYFTPTGQSQAVQQCAVKGYHLNKSRYAVVNKGDPYVVEAGTKCVRNRRRNALNPRALNRAVSRVAAAKKYAKMLDRIEIKGRRRCR